MKNATKIQVDSGEQKQNQIRMSEALKERIREYQIRTHKETGLDVSFSVAVRALIERGLERVK